MTLLLTTLTAAILGLTALAIKSASEKKLKKAEVKIPANKKR
tara:strand:+ start:149862 stop:149987 length:126 start_codon:yes stop_codon:yes gene_type:complete